MAQILVIEDDPGLQKVLGDVLRQAGHDALPTLSGAEGLVLAEARRPDLILLDWLLPDLSGSDVCRLLKADATTRGIPVVFVTARADEIDRVLGFELGAADYVVKPFSVRELVLRISAILRRMEVAAPTSSIAFGCLQVDEDAHRVWVDGEELELTALELRLLLRLYRNRTRVQTRPALLESVWGMEAGITTRTVDTHVMRLRDKLGRAGEYIQTVRGIGYRFAVLDAGADGD